MSRRYLLSVVIAVLVVTVLAFLFEIVGLISYGLMVVSAWITIVIAVVWLLLQVLRKLRLVRRSFRLSTPLKLPLLLFVAGSAGIIVMNFYAPAALPPSTSSISEQLAYMYETDQGDRFALRFRNLNERDQQRLQQVLTLYEQGLIEAAEDQYHAAMILQHGTEAEHYELAYRLAKQASEAGVWQAAYDRWMMAQGKPQVYGTQSRATFTLFGVSIEQQ